MRIESDPTWSTDDAGRYLPVGLCFVQAYKGEHKIKVIYIVP